MSRGLQTNNRSNMKTSKSLVVVALLISSAGFSIAGPGPQYWQQQSQNAAAAQKKTPQTAYSNQPPAKDTATAQTSGCKGCSSCSSHS